jgi:hypothetical protein
MTVIVLPAAAVPTGVGVPVPPQAVITIEAMNAIAANGRVDLIKAHLPCGFVQYRSRARACAERARRENPGAKLREPGPGARWLGAAPSEAEDAACRYS